MKYNYSELFVKIFGNLPENTKLSITIGEMKNTIRKAIEGNDAEETLKKESTNTVKTVEISVEERRIRYNALKKILPLPTNIKKAYKKEYHKNLGGGDYKCMLYGLIDLGVKDTDTLRALLLSKNGPKGLKDCKWFDIPYRIDLLTQLTKNL